MLFPTDGKPGKADPNSVPGPWKAQVLLHACILGPGLPGPRSLGAFGSQGHERRRHTHRQGPAGFYARGPVPCVFK